MSRALGRRRLSNRRLGARLHRPPPPSADLRAGFVVRLSRFGPSCFTIGCGGATERRQATRPPTPRAVRAYTRPKVRRLWKRSAPAEAAGLSTAEGPARRRSLQSQGQIRGDASIGSISVADRRDTALVCHADTPCEEWAYAGRTLDRRCPGELPTRGISCPPKAASAPKLPRIQCSIHPSVSGTRRRRCRHDQFNSRARTRHPFGHEGAAFGGVVEASPRLRGPNPFARVLGGHLSLVAQPWAVADDITDAAVASR